MSSTDWHQPRSDLPVLGARASDGGESLQLVEYLRTLRRRWRLVLLLAAAVFVGAFASSFFLEKQYDATVEMLLREPEQVNALLDPNAGGSSVDVERDLNTNVQLIKNEDTAEAVRKRLKLDRSTSALLRQIDTKTSSTSNIVALTVRDPDPELAAALANAFAEAYVQYRITSARRRYTRAAELAKEQLAQLEPSALDSTEARDLKSRQRQLEIAAALQTGGAEIVRPAGVPKAPARPRPVLSGLLGLVLGLAFGVGTALILELLDRRLKDEAAVEEFFALPVLAAIPRPARWGGTVGHQVQIEAYGLLAANLRLAAPHGKSSIVLMVTSASPGEGKTSVTLGIARACARLGLRALAIEGDLRRPTFSRFADVSYSAGLTGILEGAGDLAEEVLWLDPVTLAAALPGEEDGEAMVGVLPAGRLPINPQRTLSQPAMGRLVETARSLADIVLIDTAPTGTVNDPLTMARLVDGIVLVARLDKTTKDAARRALRVLRNVDAPLAGVVVTNAAASERYGYYPSAAGDAEESAPEQTPVGTPQRRA